MPLFGLVSSATATSLKSSVSGFGDKVDNMFDFSSPDGKGVSAQNADPQNTILGTYDNPNSRSRALLVGSPLTNVVVGGKESYYKQEAESVIYYKRGKDGKDTKEEITDGKHAYSTFNKYSLVNYRGSFFTPGGSAKSKGVDAIEYNKIDERTLDNPTVSKIVEVTKNNAAGSSGYGYMYNYADFAMCRYNGKIPNNYLLTLRRFPYPVQDDIITPMDIDKDGKVRETDQPDIARAVTWMSEATGNSMSDIIKWSHGYNWKDESASMQTVQSNNSSRRGAFGQFLDSSVIGTAAANAAAGVDGITAQRKKKRRFRF